MWYSYRDLEIWFKKQLSGNLLGTFMSDFRWQWVEFESLRTYEPGDSIKTIDWKATAKMWEVFVRNYREEKDLQVLFIIENSKSLNFWSETKTKRELLMEIFFLLANSCISSAHSVGVMIGGEFLDFKKSNQNIIQTLGILDNQVEDVHIKSPRISQCNMKDTLVFVLTDSLDPDFSLLKFLQVNNEVVYMNISDFFEKNLSDDDFTFEGNNLFSYVPFLGIGKTSLKTYRSSVQEWDIALERALWKKCISSIFFDTRDDIFAKMYKFFELYKKIR